MAQSQGARYNFAEQLRLETDYVLQDLIFKRSPVQSKLLRYLVDATLREGPPPGQYEIAVDALGKDPDFDLANDSYPRVQISRLRTNLDNYYARNRPKAGVRIVLGQGQYRLGLEEVDERGARIASVPRDESEASYTQTDAEPLDQLGRPGAGRPPSEPMALTSVGQQWREKAKARMVLIGGMGAVIAALVAFIVIGGSNLFGSSAPVSPVASGKPSVALSAVTKGLVGDGSDAMDEVELSLRSAEMQLAYSFVSRLHPEDDTSDPDYLLELDFGQRRGSDLGVFISVAERGGEVLYFDEITLDPANPENFSREIEAALVYIVSPTGAIGSNEFDKLSGTPRSSYECFIAIENQRAAGTRTSALVDRCIADFPGSAYSPFFLARRAFSQYQQRQLAGEPIEKSGSAWADVTTALEEDRFNPFANFTAAKVELANGNCSGALAHINRAFEMSSSYPAMIVALEAEASSCPLTDAEVAMTPEQLRLMIERNPSPDALLHLYLLIAALATDDIDNARMLTSRPRLPGNQGMEETTIQLLQQALASPEFARANAARIERSVSVFIWGDGGVDRVVQNLTKG